MDEGASLLLLITYYLTLFAIDLVQVMASSMATAIAIAEESAATLQMQQGTSCTQVGC
jgi:hypothetical protein